VQRAAASLLLVVLGIVIPLTVRPSTTVLVVMWLVVSVLLIVLILTWPPVAGRIWKTVARKVEPFLTPSASALLPTDRQVSPQEVQTSLLELRAEAVASRDLIAAAIERGRFWSLSEGPPKLDKTWKAFRPVLAAASGCNDVFAKATVAARHVARVNTTSSFRFFSGKRHVRSEDDLSGALDAIENLQSALNDALAKL
jgi:hypothetical protein